MKQISNFWLNFASHGSAVCGLVIIVFLLLVALAAPLLAPQDPFAMDLKAKLEPPSTRHLMGTDQFGRDLLSRIIYGTRVSLTVGFVSAGLAVGIGITVGAMAGYYRGVGDSVLSWIINMFLMIPVFFLILVTVSFFPNNIYLTMAVIGLTVWPSVARLVRAEYLSLRDSEFVQSAQSMGASSFHIIVAEILPNAIYPAIVAGSLLTARAILIEAGLSFLGLGDPNLISWGWIMNESLRVMRQAIWVPVFPGLFIAVSVISFHLIGDGINDALNPRLEGVSRSASELSQDTRLISSHG